MYCKYCGNQVDDNAFYCSKCGKMVRELNPLEVNEAIDFGNTPSVEENDEIDSNSKKKKVYIVITILIMIIASIISHAKLIREADLNSSIAKTQRHITLDLESVNAFNYDHRISNRSDYEKTKLGNIQYMKEASDHDEKASFYSTLSYIVPCCIIFVGLICIFFIGKIK